MFLNDSTEKGKNSYFRSSDLWCRKIQDTRERMFICLYSYDDYLLLLYLYVRRYSTEFNLHHRQITILSFGKSIRNNYEFLTEFCHMNSPLHISVWTWLLFHSCTSCLRPNWRCTCACCKLDSTMRSVCWCIYFQNLQNWTRKRKTCLLW
jgi:hypothetical protein